MSIKNIFSPNLSKIILFLVLILATFLIPKETKVCPSSIGDELSCYNVAISGIGYPVFYGNVFEGNVGVLKFDALNFILNIFIYYMFSCIIAYMFYIIFEKE